ncbi:FtsX-like permease family protein [Saccharibacillus kuerlensis]
MVMIFFSFAVFIHHPWIKNNKEVLIELNRTAYKFMLIAEYIIFIFAFLFILYSISVFLKSRRKEFGLLSMLGASRKQLNSLVFLENMLIGSVAIMSGIILGLPSSKFFLLISARIAGLPDLPFYWPLQAIGLTAFSFAALFLVISLFTLLFVSKKNVLDWLKGDVGPKKEPRVSILLVLLCVVLIATLIIGLNHAFRMKLSIVILLIAALIGGTYLFYSQLSIFVLRLLKHNRTFTWRKTRLLWISEMAYKSKNNSLVLFLTTIMLVAAAICSAFLIASFRDARSSYIDNPYSLIMIESSGLTNKQRRVEQDISEINDRLAHAGVTYYSERFTKLYDWYGNPQVPITVMSKSVYDSSAPQWNAPPAELNGKDETMLLYDKRAFKAYSTTNQTLPSVGQSMTLNNSNITFQLTSASELERLRYMNISFLLVVSDQSYAHGVKRKLAPFGSTEIVQVNYNIPDWTFSKLERGGQEDRVGRQLVKWGSNIPGEVSPTRIVRSTGITYLDSMQELSMIGFIGIFITFMFSFASASFLYFKLFAELARDSRVYNSLSKIGLSVGEMKNSATIQMALLFFLPIAVATIQALIVLRPVLTLAQMEAAPWPIFITTGTFLVLQLLYFGIARHRYLKQLKNVMV